VIAPDRAKRPGAARAQLDPPTAEELESCPFCAGHEEMTPPQTLALPDQGDWRVRVVPNLYPALERQEVVVHSRRHIRSLAELEGDEPELIAEAWQRRAAAEAGYVHALVNEGREAGSSLPHSHSQLAWLPDPPSA
jgi:UDPglucose--hexose-1-phosphate uridylyltransferase